MNWFMRWKYRLLIFRDYGAALNRRVEVENALLSCASGKRGLPSREECRQMAYRLAGVQEWAET